MSRDIGPFELIVHVGIGKTGSSSIQKTLSANKAILRESGVAYLGLMCEEAARKLQPWQKVGGWPEMKARDNPGAQLQKVLVHTIREVVDAGIRRAIWSNEALFDNHQLVIPVLKHLESRGVEIRFVAYVRRHDAWMRSAYYQWGIKHKTNTGPVKPFKEWRQTHARNFSGDIKCWLKPQWKESVVRNYDACSDVVVDFLEHCGVPRDNLVLVRNNETPHATALAMWAMFNSQFKEKVVPNKLEVLLNEAGILQQEIVDCDFAALVPRREDIEAVDAEASLDRGRINEILRACLQPEMDVSPLKPHENMVVTQNQINAALLMILRSQFVEIAALRKTLNSLAAGNGRVGTGLHV